MVRVRSRHEFRAFRPIGRSPRHAAGSRCPRPAGSHRASGHGIPTTLPVSRPMRVDQTCRVSQRDRACPRWSDTGAGRFPRCRRSIERFVEDDRGFVSEGRQLGDATAGDPARDDATGEALELEFGAGAGLHAKRRDEPGATSPDVDQRDHLTGAQHGDRRPAALVRPRSRNLAPLDRDQSARHAWLIGSNLRMRTRPVEPSTRTQNCGPAGLVT